jgi:3-hydroxy acid dehydrogenase / malonic semialdehyde reductase
MSDVVLVTGASSGIGLATARLFAQNHYSVIVTGRREKRLKDFAVEMKNMFNVEVLPLKMDVSNYSNVKAGIESLVGDWKNIKILINNAGLAVGLNYIHEGNIEDWDRMIDTNLKGLLYVSREVIPGMIARGEGHIINIGSIAGKETYLKGNVYCATKHGVDSITKALRIELVKYGIRVTQIAPGAVETEFSKVRFKDNEEMAAKVYQGFAPLQPENVAGAIYYAATLPQHVCINDMLIMPTAQADTVHWNR